jgi:hypothetical protein
VHAHLYATPPLQSSRIDKYDTIDAITYLGKAPLEVSNISQLIGMPQMYLNRLVPRYDEVHCRARSLRHFGCLPLPSLATLAARASRHSLPLSALSRSPPPSAAPAPRAVTVTGPHPQPARVPARQLGHVPLPRSVPRLPQRAQGGLHAREPRSRTRPSCARAGFPRAAEPHSHCATPLLTPDPTPASARSDGRVLRAQTELQEDEAFATIAADLRERLEIDLELPSREELRAAVQSSSRQLVEKRLVEYLQTNQNHLSMYLVPSAPVMRQMEDSDLIHGRRER